MKKMLQFNLVEGAAFDCIPDFVLFVESFDTVKNENFEDATTFLLVHSLGQVSHRICVDDYEAVKEELSDPDWLEVTNEMDNRCLIRKSQIVSRESHPEGGSVIGLMIHGNPRVVHVKSTVQELRD